MYSIIFTNGNILHVKADMVEWSGANNMVRFTNDGRTAARLNADSIAGWIDADCEVEPESKIIDSNDFCKGCGYFCGSDDKRCIHGPACRRMYNYYISNGRDKNVR